MKYLIFIVVLWSCTNSPKKVLIPSHRNDSFVRLRKDSVTSDLQDPFMTAKDTTRLNHVMDLIYNFSEVQALDKLINDRSKATHGVSMSVKDNFGGDTSYYSISVGDNSKTERWEPVYNFLLVKKTNELRVYEPDSDSIMTIKLWRKIRADNVR